MVCYFQHCIVCLLPQFEQPLLRVGPSQGALLLLEQIERDDVELEQKHAAESETACRKKERKMHPAPEYEFARNDKKRPEDD